MLRSTIIKFEAWVEDNICKFAKKGLTPSQIGVILRDSLGIAQVRSVTGSKILRILGYCKKHRGGAGDEVVPKREPAIISVEGRGFTVGINYVQEPVVDYLRAVVSTVFLIHKQLIVYNEL